MKKLKKIIVKKTELIEPLMELPPTSKFFRVFKNLETNKLVFKENDYYDNQKLYN